MIGVGFEPTPPKRLVPKTSALDRSAIQPEIPDQRIWHIENEKKYFSKQKVTCVHRDSNPNLILGRDKYYPCTMDAVSGLAALFLSLLPFVSFTCVHDAGVSPL